MPTWVYNPHTGGKSIPPASKGTHATAHSRLCKQALPRKVHPNRRPFPRCPLLHRRVHRTWRAARKRSPAGETRDQWIDRLSNTPTHLCRIRYFGNEDRWSLAWYSYAHEKYEPGFLITGEDHGTPEEAFETSAQFL